MEQRLLIDGSLVPASDGATFDNINPATEQVIGVAADAGPADTEAAIAAARRAFDETSWSTDVAFRVRCLRQLNEALTANVEELRAATVAEVGAPISLTYGPQLETPIEGVTWIADPSLSRRAGRTRASQRAGARRRSRSTSARPPPAS